MPDERFDLRTIDFREVFPWIHLFRGFRIALDLKKVALGAAGALAMSLGWWMIAFFFVGWGTLHSETAAVETTPPAETKAASATESSPAEPEGAEARSERAQIELERQARQSIEQVRLFPWQDPKVLDRDVYRTALDPQRGWVGYVPNSAFLVAKPIQRLILPIRLVFRSRMSAIAGILLTAWSLVVWALFGGAITRIAAVQVARDGHVGLTESIRFVLGRYGSYLGAPILPFLGVVLIVVFSAIAGVLMRLPGLNVVVALFWFLPLAVGFVMTIALFGLVLSWPMMYSAISAEATESFDALSRSYSYVLGRPWNYLFYTAIALLYGGILMTFVVTMGYAVVDLSQYAIAWGGGETNLRSYFALAPAAGGWRADFGPVDSQDGSLSGTTHATALFVGLWTHVFFMALVGFAFSYFWSSATIVYFLLRRDVDQAEIEEVFLEEEEEEPFPTVAPSLGPPAASHEPPRPGSGVTLPVIDPPPTS